MLYLIGEKLKTDYALKVLNMENHIDELELFNRDKIRFKVVDDFNKLYNALNYFRIPFKMVVNHPTIPDPDGCLSVSKDEIIDFKIFEKEILGIQERKQKLIVEKEPDSIDKLSDYEENNDDQEADDL